MKGRILDRKHIHCCISLQYYLAFLHRQHFHLSSSVCRATAFARRRQQLPGLLGAAVTLAEPELAVAASNSKSEE